MESSGGDRDVPPRMYANASVVHHLHGQLVQSTVKLAAELYRRGFGMVGTYRTDRVPHLEEVSLGVKKPTATVLKGVCKTAHNNTNTVRAYQVMDNKAVTFLDNYYSVHDPLELIRVEHHTVARNALNVPHGMTWYNAKMGTVDSIDSQKANHYSLESVLKRRSGTSSFFSCCIVCIEYKRGIYTGLFITPTMTEKIFNSTCYCIL